MTEEIDNCPVELENELRIVEREMRERGLRWTSQRRLIAKVALSNHTHFSAEELLEQGVMRLERRLVAAPLSLSQQRYGAAISLRGFLRAARPRVLLRLLGKHKCLVDHILFELLREQGTRHR